MGSCGICKKDRSKFILNNKRVCLVCDELLFDLEIELEDESEGNSVKLLRTSKEAAEPTPGPN